MSDPDDTPAIAPDFTAKDVFGKTVKLSAKTRGYTLLAFLRYSGCPWCNLAIHRLSLEHKRLKELNCRIVAFVQSDASSIKENIYDRHQPRPQFPIIADDVMKYYKLYDVNVSVASTLGTITKIPYWLESVHKHGFKQRKMDGSLFLVPAWFLINHRTSEIVQYKKGVSFYNYETFTSIYDSLVFSD